MWFPNMRPLFMTCGFCSSARGALRALSPTPLPGKRNVLTSARCKAFSPRIPPPLVHTQRPPKGAGGGKKGGGETSRADPPTENGFRPPSRRYVLPPPYLASPSVTFGVSFFAVFLGHSLCTKEKGFYCLQGRSEGLFRKMTLVFPCFVVYATYEQVSLSHAYMGRFPGNSLVLAKYPNEK